MIEWLPAAVIVVGGCAIAVARAMAYRRGQFGQPPYGGGFRQGVGRQDGSGRPSNLHDLNLALLFEAKTGTPIRCFSHSAQGSRCALIAGHGGEHCWEHADLAGGEPPGGCGSKWRHATGPRR